MIYLDTTTKSLKLVLDGAVATNQLEISTFFYDDTRRATATPKTGGQYVTLSNSTTDVTIVAAPGAVGTVRNIHTIFINNKDTVTRTVTVKLDNSGTQTIVVKQAIAAGESLVYEDKQGWNVLSPITAPFVDTTEIVKGSLDATKRLRIEVDGITTGTTRVWTVADADIVVSGSASAMITGRVVYTTTGGLLTSSANFTFDGTDAILTTGANGFNITRAGDPLLVINSTAVSAGTLRYKTNSTQRWDVYIPSGSTDLRWYTTSDIMTLTSAGALSLNSTDTCFTANTTTNYGLVITTATAKFSGMQIARTVNTPSSWDIYTPAGSTDLRFFANTADRLTLTNAGALTITSALNVQGGGATISGAVTSSIRNNAAATTLLVGGNVNGGLVYMENASAVAVGGISNRKAWVGSGADGMAVVAGTGYGIDFFTNNSATVGMTLSTTNNLTVSGTGPHAIGGIASAFIQFRQTGAFTGAANAIGFYLDSTITPVAGNYAAGIEINPTLVKAGSGTHSDFSGVLLQAPIINAGAATLTNATTLKIINAPSVGTNQRALWVAAGLSEFAGDFWVSAAGGFRIGSTGGKDRIQTSGSAFTMLTSADTNAALTVAAFTATGAITYGGVTLSNAVTGTGNMVLSASPTLSGTATLPSVTMAASANLTNGVTVTAGSYSTGSITVDYTKGPLATITNGGAYTITNSASDGSQVLLVTNNGSAGATTFTGFTVSSNTGDPLTTTNTNKFMITLVRINGTSTYHIKALQ